MTGRNSRAYGNEISIRSVRQIQPSSLPFHLLYCVWLSLPLKLLLWLFNVAMNKKNPLLAGQVTRN